MRSTGSTSSRRSRPTRRRPPTLAQSFPIGRMSSPGYFKDLQNRLKKFVESGQLGPFKNGYWGSPAYKLPPEANLMAVAHYLEALDFQKDIVKIHTIFGGKNPHPELAGRRRAVRDQCGRHRRGRRDQHGAPQLRRQHHRPLDRIHRKGLSARPARRSPRSTRTGSTAAASRARACMAYGDIPEHANDYSVEKSAAAARRDHQRQSRRGAPGRSRDPEQIQEFVTHSWYKYPDETKGLHPWDGVTEPNYALGPERQGHAHATSRNSTRAAKYSWIKAPRWRAMRWRSDRSRAGCIGYAQGNARVQGSGRPAPEEARRARDRAVLDARPHRGARPGMPVWRGTSCAASSRTS